MNMIDCVSVENMRISDAYTIGNFVPSLELMYRAAWGVFQAASWKGRTAIVVGSGNNGGDGFALACILKEHGHDCSVFTVSHTFSEDSAYYAQKAGNAGVFIAPFSPNCLAGYDIVVDCLLGTGFRGTLREPYSTAVNAINRSGAYVISVDINSGMNGDTGEGTLAVRSNLTVTIGFVKTGLITENAGRYIGRLVCTDIGIILAKEEHKIVGSEEPMQSGYMRCPSWLDMNIQKAY